MDHDDCFGSFYLLEGPALVLEIHADFVRMLLHGALEHLGDGQIPLLVDVDQHEELEIPPGPPGITTRGVIEKVESVVAPGYQI